MAWIVHSFSLFLGEVYAHNESTLVVKDFTYDGEGVDVFFWAVTGDTDGEGVILPHPFSGTFYQADDKDAPVLARAQRETVILQIPPQVKLTDIRRVAIYSRQFGVDYGSVKLPESEAEEEVEITTAAASDNVEGCRVGDTVYRYGEEFHKDCEAYCICQDNGEPYCSDIQCPSEFGLDVINPNCIEWDKHEGFEPSAPTCCPPAPVCLSDGSCEYKGATFTNYDSIPEELTGCEQRCHCEDGEVKCRDACYQISASPPSWLPCEPSLAQHIPNPDRSCCLIWGCVEPPRPDFQPPDKLLGAEASPVNGSCISISFEIPPSVGGMKAYYSVGYSVLAAGHPDPSNWPAARISPPGGKIPESSDQVSTRGNDRDEALVCSLLPGLDYLFQPSVVLEEHEDSPIIGDIVSSKIPPQILTPDPAPSPFEYLDMRMAATKVTTNSARVSWRSFNETSEKPEIDSVQLRYILLENDIPVSIVPVTSPFIHRDTNYWVFENLSPNTEYEVDMDIVPVPGAKTEFYNGIPLKFTTEEFIDQYDFKPALSVLNVSDNTVEVSWSGVPSPDQKFVNIYRVIYHSISSDVVREESSVFKISKIDSPKKLSVTGLEPGLDYQIWLESYLTNGKIVKSNVVEFRTQEAPHIPAPALPKTQGDSTNDYYQSMVAASIIAALALLVLVVILWFYIKRHTTYKATITKAPPSSHNNGNTGSGAYDNPAFKGFENDGNRNQTLPSSATFELGPLTNDDREREIR